MVVDQTITEALNRIAENQEEMNATLTRIANHYDGVVPVMTRNQQRVEKAHEEADVNEPKQWDDKLKSIFSH
jgi:hypothetical protein